MQKYRVVKTNVGGAFRNRLITECLFDNLSEDEANYALANLIDLGNIGCSVEKYDWIAPEFKRLGRDPDLH
jgi:hypothetical protein